MAVDNTTSGSKNVQKADPPTFTSYVNVSLYTDKLDESNYDSWAFDIKLWFTSQDYADHFSKRADDIPALERSWWSRIDA